MLWLGQNFPNDRREVLDELADVLLFFLLSRILFLKRFFVLLKDVQSLRHGEQGVTAESEQVPSAEFSLLEHQAFLIR